MNTLSSAQQSLSARAGKGSSIDKTFAGQALPHPGYRKPGYEKVIETKTIETPVTQIIEVAPSNPEETPFWNK